MEKLNWKNGLEEMPEYDTPVILRYVCRLERFPREPFVSSFELLSTLVRTTGRGHEFHNFGEVRAKDGEVKTYSTSTTSTFKGKNDLKNMYWTYIDINTTDLEGTKREKLGDLEELKKRKIKDLEKEFENKKQDINNMSFIKIPYESYTSIMPKIKSSIEQRKNEDENI